MLFYINAASGVPVYQQIKRQVKQAVTGGALKPGDQLPPVRKLGGDYGINPNTVARAYQELVEEKVLRAVQGGGTFVADGAPELKRRQLVERLRQLASQIAVEGQQMGLPAGEILRIVEDEVSKLL